MAGDRYSRVSARFWVDTKVWSERDRLVTLYLLTNAHSSMEGLYHLPIGYLCADLNLAPKQAHAALSFIEAEEIVSYDTVAEVVFICKALKHGAPSTANHITGAINRLTGVPRTRLWDAFLVACECHANDLFKRIRMERVMRSPLSTSTSSSRDNTSVEALLHPRLRDAFLAEGQSGARAAKS